MCASGMGCSECDTSIVSEENLYVIEDEIAVSTACYGNEGDVLSVCSFILLLQKNRQDKRDLPTCYIRRIGLFFLMQQSTHYSCSD